MGLKRWFKDNFEIFESPRSWSEFLPRGGILKTKAERERERKSTPDSVA